jgi:hypothetical protein
MASVISAAMTKFDGLTAANFPSSTVPDIYLDESPVVDGGAQKYVPYAVITDEGESPENHFGQSVIETSRFKVTLYYPSLADADAAALAVRLNGGTPQQQQGFDFGTLTGLPAGFAFKSLVRTGSRRFFAGYAKAGGRVHAVELSYEATVQL